MSIEEIKTLEDLRDFINEIDEWDLRLDSVIESLGFENLSFSPSGVCAQGHRLLYVDEFGVAQIKDDYCCDNCLECDFVLDLNECGSE